MKNCSFIPELRRCIEKIEFVGDSIYIYFDDNSFYEVKKNAENYDFFTNKVFKGQILANLDNFKIKEFYSKIKSIKEISVYLMLSSVILFLVLIVGVSVSPLVLLFLSISIGTLTVGTIGKIVKFLKDKKNDREFIDDLEKFMYYLDNEPTLAAHLEKVKSSEEAEILLSNLELSCNRVVTEMSSVKQEGLTDSLQLDTNVVNNVTYEELIKYKKTLLAMKTDATDEERPFGGIVSIDAVILEEEKPVIRERQ